MVEDEARQAWHGAWTLRQEVGRVGGRRMGQLMHASQIQRRQDRWKRKRYRGWRTRTGKMTTQSARKSKTHQHQRMMRKDVMGSTHRKLCGRRQRKETQEQAGRGAGEAVGTLTVTVAPTPCRPSPRPQTAGPVARRATLARRPQSASHRNRNARRPQSARVSIDTTLFEDMLALQKDLQNTPARTRTTTRPRVATSDPTARSVSRKRRPQSAR